MDGKDLNYKQQLDIWLRANNISREKLDLFRDFIISLNDLIDKTFLGSEVCYLDDDIKGHFNWCWDKVIFSFEKEKIFFKSRGNNYTYIWNFFLEAFYIVKKENNEPKIVKYVDNLFDFNHNKSRSELDVLYEIYKLFEQNLRK